MEKKNGVFIVIIIVIICLLFFSSSAASSAPPLEGFNGDILGRVNQENPISCNFGEKCPPGYYCTGAGPMNPNQICAPYKTLGQTCANYPGPRGSCMYSLMCDPYTNTCTPFGNIGAKCQNSTYCISSLMCDPFTNKCAPLGIKGAKCMNSANCSSPYKCSRKHKCE